MARPVHPPSSQRGGITILVVLSLLVLLTVAAMGMSRNSLREMMIVGSSRQAASVRQTADSGIDFAILWSDPQNKAEKAGAISFQAKMRTLLESPEEKGKLEEVATGADMKLLDEDIKQRFDLKILRLDKMPGGLLSTVTDERLLPDIWVVRSTGWVEVAGLTYRHDKELWSTTPAQTE